MSERPAVVRLNGIDLHCGLIFSGDRLRLTCSAEEWVGYGVGRRVSLVRNQLCGVEWYRVDGVLRAEGLAVVVLIPTDPPPREKPYWPPIKGDRGAV